MSEEIDVPEEPKEYPEFGWEELYASTLDRWDNIILEQKGYLFDLIAFINNRLH